MLTKRLSLKFNRETQLIIDGETMRPILPREMLWTDLKTMDEFFVLDPVNEEFFEVLVKLREEPFAVKLNDVKVFNEVYYQLTRIVYEHTQPGTLSMYVKDIKANLGWRDSVEVVMSMAYFMILLWDPTKNPINRHFVSKINMKFYSSYYWEPFHSKYTQLKDKMRLGYTFAPRPQKVDYFKEYIDWRTITRDYDLSCIEHVLYLWPEKEDQRVMAAKIKSSLSGGLFVSYKLGSEEEQICRFLEKYLGEAGAELMSSESDSPYNSSKTLREQFENAERDNQNLRTHIRELEADNARLKTLLDDKNQATGVNRKFTLVEIVNYCKKKPGYEFVEQIVAMLYKFIRKGSDEEQDLVDSIDEDFNNRIYGNTYIGQQTNVSNVGTYNEEVKTQNNNFPMPQIGGQQQKRITDD